MPERVEDVVRYDVGFKITFRQDPGKFLRKPALRDRFLDEHVLELSGLLIRSSKSRELGFERFSNEGM